MVAADITLNQLGGCGRLKMMIGAKDFFSDDDGMSLTFKFAGKVANWVKIRLNAMDLYDIEFKKIGRLSRKTYEVPVKTTGEFEGIGVENLKSTFEEFTGLYLSLA